MLADANVDDSASPLIASVRRDPFSVVLLDEFEKAAAPIRDLFLQLFDDGRLTDRSGRATDFRHCLVIMTSNVGSALQLGPGLGFASRAEPFRSSAVERALAQAFRPEFLSRIDRIVVFKPFERAQMRALLEKEIDDVRLRRGLRHRPWAIEIDETAIEFLIEQGFSPHLGARPLKRAVEQHVLTPLARTIADAQVPTGDQFLFLSARDSRIEVEFVGLELEEQAAQVDDADLQGTGDRIGRRGSGDDGLLRDRVLRGVRRAQDTDALAAILQRTRARVFGEVALRKELLLAELGNDDFWERDDRYPILAEIEYLDRLQAATATAARLGERLAESESKRALADVSEILAMRLHVLEQALAGLEVDAPFELFLRLRLSAETDAEPRGRVFLAQIAAMYDGWAVRRGMKIRTLSESKDELVVLVSGLGCGMILASEARLHVQELVDVGRNGASEIQRITVSVTPVEASPGENRGGEALLTQAREALDSTEFSGRVVRRYRLEPDPLVRDAVRGYRTGRADLILAGNFDVF